MELVEEGVLYKLMNVDKKASEQEIRKSYKLLTRKYHPDLNPDDPEAKRKFQDLSEAYKILSDPNKRRIYDMTGEVDGEGVRDISKFIEAYQYYREKFKEITSDDIDEYKKTYVDGPEEAEDLLSYFEDNEGDMTALLESIPYSTSGDKPRFIDFFTNYIKENLKDIPKEYRDNFKATKNSIRNIKLDLTEQESKNEMKSLINQIQSKNQNRFGDMMSGMFAKYGDSNMMALEEGTKKKKSKSTKIGKKKSTSGKTKHLKKLKV